jgi:hypothetical protein
MVTQAVPVAELREQAARVRPGRVLATAVSAAFAAIGWALGRGLLVLGWVAGRTWLVLAFMAEAVVWGFRQGAALPSPVMAPPPEAPNPRL